LDYPSRCASSISEQVELRAEKEEVAVPREAGRDAKWATHLGRSSTQ
jgi:hypothetical protein